MNLTMEPQRAERTARAEEPHGNPCPDRREAVTDPKSRGRSSRAVRPRRAESPWPLASMDVALRQCAGTIAEGIGLYRAEDLLGERETVQSFTALVNSLCRVSERLLRQLEVRQRLQKPVRHRGGGMPPAVVEQLQEELKLL